jgi:DNA-directed RNA polymerase specialized sigma24 family protein
MPEDAVPPVAAGRPRSRFRDIPTPWTLLKGPPREALEVLYRTYGRATLRYVRQSLAFSRYPGLRRADPEDLVQEFFLVLGRTGWLDRAERGKGNFRGFFLKRLNYFLGERQRDALRTRRLPGAAGGEAGPPEMPVPDPLEARFEAECREALLRLCLARMRKTRPDWHALLVAELRRSGEPDEVVARRLGLPLPKFRKTRAAARRCLKDLFLVEEARVEGGP